MNWARRIIGPIATVWLFCQAATLAVAPVALNASLAECVCAHDADASCPMHHRTAAGAKVCVMQSANASVPGSLNSLFSVAGLLPVPSRATVPVPTVSAALFERELLIQRSSPPDSPPPRG
jgi:hypothetical protein